MSESVREPGLSFAKFLSGVSSEERARINDLSRREALKEHKLFTEAFKAGQCSFCGEALTSFDRNQPCRHWLLKPDGFGKEHFESLAALHSLGVLENYLRWVANEDAFAKNINDLPDEGTGKLVELTIKSSGRSRAAQAIWTGTKVAASIRNDHIITFRCMSMESHSSGTMISTSPYPPKTSASLSICALIRARCRSASSVVPA
jgi:hypothetical protein